MTGIAAVAVTASPPVLACSAPTNAHGNALHAPVTTAVVTATASGGTGVYTSYSWAQVGSSAETWAITSPSTASTAFQCVDVADGDIASADFQCTVTDSGSHVAASNTVAARAFARGLS